MAYCNADRGLNGEDVLRFSSAEIVTFKVENPQLIECLSHLLTHPNKAGSS